MQQALLLRVHDFLGMTVAYYAGVSNPLFGTAAAKKKKI